MAAMHAPLPITRVTIWPLTIPMRTKFRHAAAERACAEPLVVAVELANHVVGYGETHPRPYVTGETTESAIAAVREVFVPPLVDARPAALAEAFELADALPWVDSAGRCVAAARAAVELALLDVYARAFERSLASLAGWLEDAALGPPGSAGTRISGVISGDTATKAAWSARKMRLYGLRDFKLKVGLADDDARVRAVARALGDGLRSGKKSLRLDANGAWDAATALARLQSWGDLPIACVEQPLPRGEVTKREGIPAEGGARRDSRTSEIPAEGGAREDSRTSEQPLPRGDNAALAALAAGSPLPLMADESLVTVEDAEDLIVRRAAAWFNIRIGKNGGLIPSLRLASMARRHGIHVQLGCLVGETSILSAAWRWFMHLTPEVRFAEGHYGRWLLRDDVTQRPLTMRWGGRWDPPCGGGLGVEVDAGALARLGGGRSMEIPL